MQEYKFGEGDILVKVPDGYGVMGYAPKDCHSYTFVNGVKGIEGVDGLIKLSVAVLGQGAPTEGIAGFFARLRIRLKDEGIMGDDVDIAVAVDGKVIPLDELAQQIKEEMQDAEED